MEILIIALLAVAIIAVVALQAVTRHRRLSRREAEGQTTLPRSTWIVFCVMAAFLVFAVFVFPTLVRK
ncbi:hypothetical protein [Frondihabitans australicus]|uniref:Uncharacterized protein n=1 Tax=Frondihabitans australicus TaxID=386892 RepID=A0A495IAF6_9MICO|nr:hypothetical protein [Frondihabitans australicus]RKR72997.1 hypothetical protein C8E83_0079 [Frondihabitans australicus]